LSCPRVSYESKNQGAITYLSGNDIYAAAIDSGSGAIVFTKLFSINPLWIASDTIADIMVADLFTVFKMTNNDNY
jgi:hypothetical protein